ncbi:ABC transporter permease [Bordetella sp. 15P40C-2]|uniref:ABC transporter permease n=1 Tax=Bordetella sp. 15P40C-2 TaxID=2572246 RepID=UPI001326BCA2|nr:ABC transporter permease [Bordetella sp. 15P40C-2]MVW72930.1 ABC transporter permease subunit [Bordetella sp. 15P40C-2]
MLRFVAKRLAAALCVLLAISALVFFAGALLPGDVAQAQLGQYATPEALEKLRAQLGLNQPLGERYLQWLIGMLQGDWGQSMANQAPVSMLLEERLHNTLVLAGATAVIAVPLAITLGILMVRYVGSAFDKVCSTVLLAFSATPEFLIATVAVLVLSVNLGWLPAVSYVDPNMPAGTVARALVLPVLVLVLHVAAQIARMTRATINNVMAQPYIEMAALKGASRMRCIVRHALPNAIGPIANVVALNVAYMISGVVVVETIFAYPGMARLMIDAVTARDMPVVAACAMIFSLAYIGLMFLTDVLAIASNPRLRNRREGRAV